MEEIEMKELTPDEKEILKRHFLGHKEGFQRYGKKGYLIPRNYRHHVNQVQSMSVREDDIWILGYPRSGSTMTQEMVWLLRNDLNYEKASKTALRERYYFVEFFTMIKDHVSEFKRIEGQRNHYTDVQYQLADLDPCPRHLKSHLPLSLLPPKLLDTSKVIYLARDPRDVAISYFHQNKLFKFQGYCGDFKTYWKLFINDLVPWTPYFPHVLEAWNLRRHPNMLFMFYEDIIKDIPKAARRVASFLGRTYSEEEIENLANHLDIKNFRNNESVHPKWMKNSPLVNENAENFIRNGGAGGWRQYFDEEMISEHKFWVQIHLKGTDLEIPNV